MQRAADDAALAKGEKQQEEDGEEAHHWRDMLRVRAFWATCFIFKQILIMPSSLAPLFALGFLVRLSAAACPEVGVQSHGLDTQWTHPCPAEFDPSFCYSLSLSQPSPQLSVAWSPQERPHTYDVHTGKTALQFVDKHMACP